jgi:hypothetical protein
VLAANFFHLRYKIIGVPQNKKIWPLSLFRPNPTSNQKPNPSRETIPLNLYVDYDAEPNIKNNMKSNVNSPGKKLPATFSSQE